MIVLLGIIVIYQQQSVLNGGVVVKIIHFSGSKCMAKENIEIGSNLIIGVRRYFQI